MFSVINYSINQNPVNQEFDNTNQGFINSFPKELVLEIFSHLNLATLGKSRLISKDTFIYR